LAGARMQHHECARTRQIREMLQRRTSGGNKYRIVTYIAE